MKAILINPQTRTITQVEYDGTLTSIYKLLDCEMIEAPVHYGNDDIMYCDEEAWLHYNEELDTCGFMFPDWGYAVIGKALIIGTDWDGNDVDCHSKVEDFANIIWRSAVQMFKQGISHGLI